jgi:hypothetical protein
MLARAEPVWHHPWGFPLGCVKPCRCNGADSAHFRQPVGLIPNRLLRVRNGPGPLQFLFRIGGWRWQPGSGQSAGQAFHVRGSAAVESSPSSQGSSGKPVAGESQLFAPTAISTFCDLNLLRSQPSAISTFTSASRRVFRRLAEMVPSSVCAHQRSDGHCCLKPVSKRPPVGDFRRCQKPELVFLSWMDTCAPVQQGAYGDPR